MCGIAGFFNREGSAVATARVAAMLRAQVHRGPDGAGIWAYGATDAPPSFARTPGQLTPPSIAYPNCVLGHNWLAIQDTTLASSQPMQRGPLTIVFNGEIYNFVELRQKLASLGYTFKTQGDTEVLLAMWERWGEDCVPKLRGMFAFLLHDARSNSLWAVRDAFGIKPLHFTETGGGVYFGSEFRAFHFAGVVPRRIRAGAALASMCGAAHRYGEFETLYEDIQELPAGYLLRIDRNGMRRHRWFRLPEPSADLGMDSHCNFLLESVEESVKLHLRASRRVAACLSGGLDSSTLVSLIDRQGADCTAFTINTAKDADSEIDLAREVIARTSLPHRMFNHQAEIPPRDALEMAVACEVPNHVIGPINQFLLHREIASNGFSLAIEGNGGDELVSGYSWWFPALVADMSARGLDATVEKIRAGRQKRLAFDATTTNSFDDIFYNPAAWIRGFSGEGIFGVSAGEIAALPEFRFFIQHDGSWRGFRERAYSSDTIYYLLRQSDRIGMWFGLECRVPFTDASLIATAGRLAPELLIKDGYLKYPFRHMDSGIPESVRWCTRKLGYWRTDNARFPWMGSLGRTIVLQSEFLRPLLPDLEVDWDTARPDQQWRVLQIALLERCAVRSDIDDVLADAMPTARHA